MDSAAIHREMRILEIVTLVPSAVDIMAAYGLHCVGCSIGGVETLDEGCRMHGYDDAEIDALVGDLNDALQAGDSAALRAVRLTAAAAAGIREIATADGRAGLGLAIIVDAFGGFCLEFRDAPEEGDHIFPCAEDPDVCVYVSPITLYRVGGSTIDVRDGRFKLDLASPCGCGGACDCVQR